MKLLAAKEFNKVFYACYNGKATKHRMKIRAELVHLDGNKKPYFSITGEVERRAGNNRWVFESGGAIHDQIAQQMPELKPLLLVHLADDNGVPMHAFENAGYWAGQTKYQQLDLETLADHLRVTRQEAFEMINTFTIRGANLIQLLHLRWLGKMRVNITICLQNGNKTQMQPVKC